MIDEAPGPVRFEVTSPEDASAVWEFGDAGAPTLVTRSAHNVCRVAGQRADASETVLRATGPDGDDVLRLMRTFA